jgi:hypothetical protein
LSRSIDWLRFFLLSILFSRSPHSSIKMEKPIVVILFRAGFYHANVNRCNLTVERYGPYISKAILKKDILEIYPEAQFIS